MEETLVHHTDARISSNPSISPTPTYSSLCRELESSLSSHPNQDHVNYFLDGLTAGFKISFATPANLHAAKRNMSSATDHPTVVEDYFQAELDHNRIFGPFANSQCQSVHISRFRVIPKHHQTNKWHLIVNLFLILQTTV